ncbi:MAG TPA: shikimate dehydrogenase [Gemmatimonadales bacterium]|nr:shikimate dehydrogenase [Gemmatimonadales bacterium]
MIDGSTRVFAILGDPVAHSLSPAMHNAAFRVLGLRAVYVPIRCAAGDLAPLLRALASAGGGGNVTVPHKEAAARVLDRPRPMVDRLEACNTFWGEGDEAVGDNTDVAGVLAALDELEPPPGPWLVLGTGGAARAVVGAACDRGAAVAVTSRSADRRRRFEDWAAGLGVRTADAAACAVVVNTTPLGLHPGDALPLAQPPAPATVALDLTYAPGETEWVRAMRAAGLRAADGRGMLVAQGAAALECWFPRVRAPVEVMRAAVDAQLR